MNEENAQSGNPWNEQGGVAAEAGKGQGDEGQQQQQAEGAATDEQQQQQAGSGMSRDDIKNLLSEVVQQTAPAQQQQVQKEFTQDDFDRTFKVVKIGTDTLKGLGFAEPNETQVVAFNQFAQALVQQAVTMAAFYARQQYGDLEGKFKPAMEITRQYQEEKIKAEFFSEYEDLKDFEPLVMEVKDALMAKGVQFKDKKSAFKTVAEQTKKLLSLLKTQNNGGTNNGQSGGSATQGQAKTSRMSTLSGGGQGGARGGAGASTNTAKTLWG